MLQYIQGQGDVDVHFNLSFFLSITILSFYNHENRLHKAVLVVYGELSGGCKMVTADEVKQMIQIQKEFLTLPIDKVIPYENNPRVNDTAGGKE